MTKINLYNKSTVEKDADTGETFIYLSYTNRFIISPGMYITISNETFTIDDVSPANDGLQIQLNRPLTQMIHTDDVVKIYEPEYNESESENRDLGIFILRMTFGQHSMKSWLDKNEVFKLEDTLYTQLNTSERKVIQMIHILQNQYLDGV